MGSKQIPDRNQKESSSTWLSFEELEAKFHSYDQATNYTKWATSVDLVMRCTKRNTRLYYYTEKIETCGSRNPEGWEGFAEPSGSASSAEPIG